MPAQRKVPQIHENPMDWIKWDKNNNIEMFKMSARLSPTGLEDQHLTLINNSLEEVKRGLVKIGVNKHLEKYKKELNDIKIDSNGLLPPVTAPRSGPDGWDSDVGEDDEDELPDPRAGGTAGKGGGKRRSKRRSKRPSKKRTSKKRVSKKGRSKRRSKRRSKKR